MQCYLRYSLGAGWFVLPCAIIQQSSFLIIHQLLCGYITNPHHKPTLNLSREKTKKYKHTALISTTTKAICIQIGCPLLAWQLHWSFISLCFTLLHSTMAQLDSTSLYYTLPWLSLAILTWSVRLGNTTTHTHTYLSSVNSRV